MSHILLELDTTPPIINLYAPRYTINDSINVITIESNEKLAHYQDITLTDSQNNTHALTFQRESDTRYIGEINFNNFPLGEVYISAKMKDEVDNLSATVSAVIEIKANIEAIRVKINDSTIVNSNLQSKLRNEVKINDKSNKVVVKTTSI